MSQPPTPAAPAVRALAVAVAALVLVLLTGCGLRLETPPPAPLRPGVDEAARQRTSADAVALEVLAGAAVPAPDPAADPVGAARAAVAADAAAHLQLLGGLYDDGVDPEAAERAESPAATPAPVPTATAASADALVARLTEAATTARADAAAVEDGELARLLGSISVGRLLAATRLAGAAGLPGPPTPAVALPDALPDGLTPEDLAVLVAGEDAAGYGYEVVAAKHGGDLRRRAGDRAATHRDRAQAWAELGDLDGTGADPRRVAYGLPAGLQDADAAAALAQSLETTLAANYASLVAGVEPDARPAMVDALAEATAAAVAWGAPVPALPGLPEQAGR